MAANSVLPATGESIRTLDKGGIKTQVVVLDVGGSGAESIPSGSIPVSGTVGISGTVPVSGAFWQATQPVSIASMPTTAVTGTFWQATQPVSLASLPALVAGTANVGRVTPAMQVGRTLVCITYTATNAAIADTLLTVTINRGGTTSTGTTVAVTAGKTLRITGAVLTLRTTTAATPWGLLSVRMNASGAAVLASPVILPVGVAGTAAVIGNTGFANPCMDDGLEFSGANQLGFSFANNVATNVTNFSVFGYEYTSTG